MKQVLAGFLILFLFAPGLFSQTNNIVRGIVTLQNSNSQPAKNVQVTTFGANPAYTNSAGQFEIRISGGKPGQTVRLIVQKDSFQVLGPDPLIFETAIREDPNELIRIALANIQVFQERLSRFMKSIDQQIQTQSSILKNLQAEQENTAKAEALQDSIANLYKQMQALETSKEDLARKLASIDIDQASSFSTEALQRFETGDVEGALALLDNQKLDAYYEEVLKRETEVAQAKQKAIENYMVRARMQQTLLQFEEAANSYRTAIEKDSSNLANLIEFGSFLSSINLENESIPLFYKALDQCKDPLQRLDLLSNIGLIYTMQNQVEKADSVLQAAFSLSKTLDLPTPIPVLNLYNSIGFLHQSNGDLETAEGYYIEGLTLCEPLYQQDSVLYYTSWSTLHSNLSLLYLSAEEYEKWEPHSMAVIHAFQFTPGERTPDEILAYGYFLNNIGHACTQGGVYEVADSTLQLAAAICVDLQAQGLQAAIPLHALVLNNLGMVQFTQGVPEGAIPYFNQALEMNQSLIQRNPLRFQPMVALLSSNLALSYQQLGEMDAAGKYLEDAINQYKSLAALSPQAYLLTYIQHLETRLAMQQDTLSRPEMIRKKLEILHETQQLEKLFPGYFQSSVAEMSGDIAWFSLLEGNTREAIMRSRRSLEQDPSQTWVYTVLAPALLLSGDYSAAKTIYQDWKGKPYSRDETQTFGEIFLLDLDALEQEGITHPDFGKIRKLLKKK